MKPKIFRQTEKDKEKAKIVGKIMRHYYTAKEWREAIQKRIMADFEWTYLRKIKPTLNQQKEKK